MHEDEQILREVREIKKMLTGNGEPRKGLVFQVARLMDFNRWQMWFLTAILGGILFAFGSKLADSIRFDGERQPQPSSHLADAGAKP